MVEETICVMFYTDKRYTKLAKVAKDSFTSFNPEIPVYVFTAKEAEKKFNIPPTAPPGIAKCMVALAQASLLSSKKVIILGCDTITCSKLDGFLNSSEDIVATLDYPYQLVTHRISSPDSETHVNADVVCFNNIQALRQVIKQSFYYPIYFEQGGLNEVIWSDKYNFTYKIIDYPYLESRVVYNARAKGNLCDNTGEKPWARYTNLFHVIDSKLFTGLHENNPDIDKQIKIWHYCEGLGGLPEHLFQERINWWIQKGFNEETKSFFQNQCNAGNFFHEEFRI